jgi:Cu2+-containing amine oxidase
VIKRIDPKIINVISQPIDDFMYVIEERKNIILDVSQLGFSSTFLSNLFDVRRFEKKKIQYSKPIHVCDPVGFKVKIFP